MRTSGLNSRLNINVDAATSYEIKNFVTILKSKGFTGCTNGEIMSALFMFLKDTNKNVDFIGDILKTYRENGARNDVKI